MKWDAITVLIAVMAFVASANLFFFIRLILEWTVLSSSKSECGKVCTPDKCSCWDAEQKRRRDDLDRQALVHERESSHLRS
jgi:hypothetical protein